MAESLELQISASGVRRARQQAAKRADELIEAYP
jgi:hypothetical protein